MPDWSIRRGRTRTVVVLLLAVLAVGLTTVVVRESWTASSTDSRFVTDERHRVAYLRTLAHLVGALADAQSEAVRNGPVNTDAVQSTVDAVAATDRRYGASLATGQRWSDLKQRIGAALSEPGTGQAAYHTFSDILTLALDLVQRVGDTAGLIRDPQVDSYYILDAALLRLPDVIVEAGRAGDLATLAGGNAAGGTVGGAAAAQISVARFEVAQGAADTAAGLSRGIQATTRPALGGNIAGQLDTFRAAVDQLAPPTILNALTDPIDANSLPPAAGSVRVTALSLADVVLTELDGILADRQDTLTGQRAWVVGGGAGALVAVLLLLWLALARPVPAPAAKGAHGAPPSRPAGERAPADVVDVRELLDLEELVAARRPARESGGHAG